MVYKTGSRNNIPIYRSAIIFSETTSQRDNGQRTTDNRQRTTDNGQLVGQQPTHEARLIVSENYLF